MVSRRLRVFLLLTATIVPLLLAQEKKDKEEPRPDLPIEQWLRGPDRQDFKWKAEILAPRLTFQQRNLVQVRAYVDAAPIHKDDHHDFYFVLKVADEKGNWLPDETFNHYPVPPGIDKSNEIQYSAGLYAKPGQYTAAIILYDIATAKGNIWRKAFEVKPPKNDPLPRMDRDLPQVEFIYEVPSDALPTRDKSVILPLHRGPRQFTDVEWAPGHGVEFLPVPAPRLLRVDIVLNVAPHLEPNYMARTTAVQYRAVAGRMLQIGTLLSHLRIDRGCVRVSAVDLAKLSVVFDRLDGRSIDWDKLTEQVHKIDHDTVSVDILSNRKSTAGFLRDYLTNMMVDDSGCGAGNGKTDRVIVLVSHDFQFPSGTHGDHLWPDVQCACRFVHLRIDSAGFDDLEKFLKPANPRRFEVHSPEQFRKTVADLIEDLSGGRARALEAAH